MNKVRFVKELKKRGFTELDFDGIDYFKFKSQYEYTITIVPNTCTTTAKVFVNISYNEPPFPDGCYWSHNVLNEGTSFKQAIGIIDNHPVYKQAKRIE